MLKPQKLRDMNDAELAREAEDLKRSLFNLRLQKATGQLEKPHKLRETRRDIARVETILKQRLLQAAKGAK
ncbi:MAG: 50S ribosomal protein L29 [Acidobacteriota bacterium]